LHGLHLLERKYFFDKSFLPIEPFLFTHLDVLGLHTFFLEHDFLHGLHLRERFIFLLLRVDEVGGGEAVLLNGVLNKGLLALEGAPALGEAALFEAGAGLGGIPALGEAALFEAGLGGIPALGEAALVEEGLGGTTLIGVSTPIEVGLE
jgi:hypothetical protein